MNLFSKSKTKREAQILIKSWQDQNHKVVFTNGCFDVLHFGHLYLLAAAKQQGDRLVVGLNSKESVERLKGKDRPIMDDQSRIGLLCGLECVDLVVQFEEDTPFQLIKLLKPDILVKGGDYAESQIVGADFVKSLGGEVVIVPIKKGYSTSIIEKKIKASDKN